MEFNSELQKALSYIIRIVFLSICSYLTASKMINKEKISKVNFGIVLICIFMTSIIVSNIIMEVSFFSGIIIWIFLFCWIFYISKEINIGRSIFSTVIALSLNYIIYLAAIIMAFIPNKILEINNVTFNLAVIIVLHIIMLKLVFKIKKFKHGFSFLQNNLNSGYTEILIMNISVGVLISIVLQSNDKTLAYRNILFAFPAIAAMMFITIQKSLQLYYKQKLLAQELENTKKELAEKTKEIENLETENIAISKKAHTLDHKQKSLSKKIEEMMLNTEISKEEVAEVKERLNNIGQDLYKEKTAVELAKTEIPEIDDMLKYMQSECSANKIDFELQIKGNIHYMTNNLISIEDLETLLADHIKNAIIAINHTDNVNRSILVRLGKIDGIYSLYIYDSGIEFAKETLENLGKKPSTTHADEGGTGMGFMNTFDTLRKCKAGLTIEEINEPSKDNYTKAIIIKFDNKNEFKVKSYR